MKQQPLIAPKHFLEHTPESWLSYVKSLKQEPEKPSSGIFLTRTKKGKLSLRVAREPKVISQDEIETLAREAGFPISEVYLLAKTKLSILKTEAQKGKGKKK